MDILLGEALVWLGALVLYLWPAYVRHRLMWRLWFWLHPDAPRPMRREQITIAPAQNLGYQIAREPLEHLPSLWPGTLKWFGASYDEPSLMSLEDYSNRIRILRAAMLSLQSQQNAGADPNYQAALGSGLQQQGLGGLGHANVLLGSGDWRQWHENARFMPTNGYLR